MIALLIASVLSVSAHADLASPFSKDLASPFSSLKAKAVATFLSEANSPQSDIGKIIAKENIDSIDGRNPDGIIRMPIKSADLQITLITGENLVNPWHYSEYNDGKCQAGGDSATFLVALSEHTGVHAAEEMSTMLFQVVVSESLSFVVKTKPESCQEAADEAKNIKSAINVDTIKQVKIAE